MDSFVKHCCGRQYSINKPRCDVCMKPLRITMIPELRDYASTLMKSETDAERMRIFEDLDDELRFCIIKRLVKMQTERLLKSMENVANKHGARGLKRISDELSEFYQRFCRVPDGNPFIEVIRNYADSKKGKGDGTERGMNSALLGLKSLWDSLDLLEESLSRVDRINDFGEKDAILGIIRNMGTEVCA